MKRFLMMLALGLALMPMSSLLADAGDDFVAAYNSDDADEMLRVIVRNFNQQGRQTITQRVAQERLDMNKKNDENLPLLWQMLRSNPTARINANDTQTRRAITFFLLLGADETLKADVNAIHPEWNITPLAHALSENLEHIYVALLNVGADANMVGNTETGDTPLHIAPSVAAVDILMQVGADIGAQNNAGQTPLQKAMTSQKYYIYKYFTGQDDPSQLANQLINEILMGMPLATLEATATEKGVTDIDGKGRTPLHYAVLTQQLPVVEMLLGKDADPLAADEDGRTPLMVAADNASQTFEHTQGSQVPQQILDALLAQIGDEEAQKEAVRATDNTGNTMAHLTENSAILDRLVELGADINAQNAAGETPLMVHLESGHIDVARTLLENSGLNANAANEHGRTAAHYMAEHIAKNPRLKADDKFKLMNMLKERGADFNAKDNDGKTPLMTFVESDHFKNQGRDFIRIFQSLVNRSDIEATDNDGKKIDDYLNFDDLPAPIKYTLENKRKGITRGGTTPTTKGLVTPQNALIAAITAFGTYKFYQKYGDRIKNWWHGRKKKRQQARQKKAHEGTPKPGGSAS